MERSIFLKKFLLFISNGSEMLEISPFVDIFGWNEIVGDKKQKIKIVTISYGEIVNATWNLKIKTLSMKMNMME